MPPLHPGDPGDGNGEEDDDGLEFRPPLPPDDRLWRHPSEVASTSPVPGAPPAAPPSTSAAPRRAAMGPRTAVSAVIISALIGASTSLGLVAAFGGFDDEVVEQQIAVQPMTTMAGRDADEVAVLAERSAPSVAALRVRRGDEWTNGSAVVFRSDGHLLTNAHLVAEADEVDAMLHDGTTRRAEVVGTDALTDLAVLHIDAAPLGTAVFGSSESLQVGMRAVVIGAVDGGGWDTTVTTGVISALGRRLAMPDGGKLHDMIVIDAPLPAGSSGGMLVDASGSVIGVTSAVPVGDDRFGAVTPIDLAHHVADQLLEHGRVRHVWMGIGGTELDRAQAMALDLEGAVVVTDVVDGGPADEAGLLPGDLLVALGHQPLHTMSALIADLRRRHPGDTVELVVRRDDTELRVPLVLEERTPR